ncbi:TPA: hypothetical protein H2R26_004158, partial [Salmonella enterica]|nr:hypothetical protein [Salmonella enterica subsp. enterica serovar Derby]HAK2167380.1 hypothetical protein [Salmonella enterica]HAK2204185.1 hypothetical protein [Salmonella enterica]HAK6165115.1 hypothetical protein [Salmonella enterica]
MGSNIIELAKLGHERAAELKASCGAVDVQSVAQLMQLIGDLATQLEVQFVRSTNMAVQLANAESKCGELVAENAGLKDAAEFATADDMWEELGGNVMRYQYQEWYADRLKSAMEIPATSASLAEFRAQGIESGIDMLIAIMNHQHTAVSQAIDILRI